MESSHRRHGYTTDRGSAQKPRSKKFSKKFWDPAAKTWRLQSLGNFLKSKQYPITAEELLQLLSRRATDEEGEIKKLGQQLYDDWHRQNREEIDCRLKQTEHPSGRFSPEGSEGLTMGTPVPMMGVSGDLSMMGVSGNVPMMGVSGDMPMVGVSGDVPIMGVSGDVPMLVLGGHRSWEEICSGDSAENRTATLASGGLLTMGRGITLDSGSNSGREDSWPGMGHVGMGMGQMGMGQMGMGQVGMGQMGMGMGWMPSSKEGSPAGLERGDMHGVETVTATRETTQPSKPARRRTAPELDLDTVRWKEEDLGNLGHFFFNKVYRDADTDSFWRPLGHKSSRLEYLSWEELVPTEDLQKALLIYPEHWQDLEPWLVTMDNTPVTIVCKGTSPVPYRKRDDRRDRRQPLPTREWICRNHPGEGAICQCVCRRQIEIIHPCKSDYIRCNMLVLRYTSHLRVAVLSGSLKPSLWKHTLQFNWYADFPINNSLPDIENRQPAMFETDLKMTLEVLGAGSRVWIKQVDFAGLSPFISLLVSHAEKVLYKKVLYYAFPKLSWKTRIVQYPEDRVELTAFTTYVGDIEALQQLNQIFRVSPGDPINSKVKLVYPSQAHVELQVATSDLKLNDLPDTLVKFKDIHHKCGPNLHDLPGDYPLHLGNAYLHTVPYEDGRRLGWMAVGSHAINPFSWGRQTRNELELYRYDVSVLCAPYRDAGNGPVGLMRYPDGQLYEGDLCVLDLSPFLLSSLTVSQYPEKAAPFLPVSAKLATENDDSSGSCMGEIVRVRDSFCFVAAPQEGHPAYSKFAPFSTCGMNEAFLHRDTWLESGINMRMAPRVIVEISIAEYQGRLRVMRVHRTYHSWIEALQFHGIDTSQLQKRPDAPASRDSQTKDIARPTSVKGKDEQPIEEVLKECGITSEADYDEYWINQFRPGATKVRQNLRSWADTDIEKEFPLTPWTSNLTDMAWLQNHVERRCGGKLPSLVGPYNVSHVTKEFLGVRKEMMPDMAWPTSLEA